MIQTLHTTQSQSLLEKQAERTAAAIAHYREEAFSRQQEAQSLEDLTYHLLDKVNWEESISSFEDLSVMLLRLLNHPDIVAVVSKHVTKEQQRHLATMLYNLYQFFKDLDCACWRTLMEQKQVELDGVNSDLKQLKRLEEVYQQKMEQYYHQGDYKPSA
jgi:type I site-specific restriction-modification system R (restriction) subunit